jgi:hypothetical protein
MKWVAAIVVILLPELTHASESETRAIREQQEDFDDPIGNVAPEFSPERGISMGLQCKTRNGVFPIRDAKVVGGGCVSHGYGGVVLR